MSLKFNPVTGQLDLINTAAGSTPGKDRIVVDAAFLITPVKTLPATAITDSEFIFLNGLYTCDTEYTIIGDEFTWIDSSDLRVGDTIDIKFDS